MSSTIGLSDYMTSKEHERYSKIFYSMMTELPCTVKRYYTETKMWDIASEQAVKSHHEPFIQQFNYDYWELQLYLYTDMIASIEANTEILSELRSSREQLNTTLYPEMCSRTKTENQDFIRSHLANISGLSVDSRISVLKEFKGYVENLKHFKTKVAFLSVKPTPELRMIIDKESKAFRDNMGKDPNKTMQGLPEIVDQIFMFSKDNLSMVEIDRQLNLNLHFNGIKKFILADERALYISYFNKIIEALLGDSKYTNDIYNLENKLLSKNLIHKLDSLETSHLLETFRTQNAQTINYITRDQIIDAKLLERSFLKTKEFFELKKVAN